MREHKKGYFCITSVARADLESLGYDVSAVDDGTMEELARKMAAAYLDSAFWIDLGVLADNLEIPRQSETTKKSL